MESLVEGGQSGGALGISGELHRAAAASKRAYERMPIAVCVCDQDGTIVQHNSRAEELWGGMPHLPPPLAQVLGSGQEARELEILIERRDGSEVPVLVNIDPVFGESGQFIGAVGCFQDISRLKRAEGELQARERWYRELLEALPAAIYTTDAEGRITFFNQAAVALAGSTPELGSDQWCVTWKLFETNGKPLPHDLCPMAVALKEGRPVRGAEAVAERPDGRRVPFIPYPTPLYDPSGALVGAVNMLVDISERKEAESRQIGLMNELNHRVKNTLATVQALAAQTMRGSGLSEEARSSFEARLLALSRSHDQLTRTGWLATDLASILDVTLAPFRKGSDKRIHLGQEPVRLPPQAALTLAMVFHELAANAAKHGSLAASEGALDVNWAVSHSDGRPRLKLDWRESGGPAVEHPKTSGFGMRLAERSVKRALKGSLDIAFDPAGMRCTMDIPLPIGA